MWFKTAISGFLAASAFVSVAQAAPLEFEFTEFTGNDSRLHVQVSQQDANTLRFNLTQPVQGAETPGEVRAFYFNVANEALLPFLIIGDGSFSSLSVVQSANSVTQAGGSDTALNGGGLDPFDVGIGFGTQGNNGMIFNTSFTVSHTGGLDLMTFFPIGADAPLFGARLKPFADGGSSKLACDAPCGYTGSSSGGPDPREEIPVPASLAILGFGLMGLGLAGRRRKI